ncbi:MAG: hypothetical protein ACP5LN_11245 [Thermoproteota archaeon]|jgi:hypothetical protein
MRKVWRQGDIVFVEESIQPEDIPSSFTKIEKPLKISSETGKPHIVRAQVCFVRIHNGLFQSAHVFSNEKIVVEHEEHGTLFLPPGAYRVYRVREAKGKVLFSRSRIDFRYVPD